MVPGWVKHILPPAIPIVAAIGWGLVNHWQEMVVIEKEIAALKLDMGAAIIRMEKLDSMRIELARLQGTLSGLREDLQIRGTLRLQRRGLTNEGVHAE